MGIRAAEMCCGDRVGAESSLLGSCFGLFDAMPSLPCAETTILFKQGAMSRDVFLLDHGLVKVTFLDPAGEEVITDLCSQPGALIGDACAVLGRHFVSAVVVTRGTRLRRVGTSTFVDLVRSNPELSWQLHRAHCSRHAELLDRSAELSYLSVRERVEQLIWKLADACEVVLTPRGERMQLPLKYRELAQLITVTPEHLCRVLGTIEKEGLIRREKGWLYLTDRDRLYHRKTA